MRYHKAVQDAQTSAISSAHSGHVILNILGLRFEAVARAQERRNIDKGGILLQIRYRQLGLMLCSFLVEEG